MPPEKPNNWSEYYRNTEALPPSALLKQVINNNEFTDKKALDLGAGSLKDSRYLLQEGFTVDAVDLEPEVATRATEIASDNLHVTITSFSEFPFLEGHYSLINAQFSLPFCPPELFNEMFENLKAALTKNGIFCGQFFGKNDEWSSNPAMTFHSKEDVGMLLSDLEILSIEERERDGRTANGAPKHWHVIEVTARKNHK